MNKGMMRSVIIVSIFLFSISQQISAQSKPAVFMLDMEVLKSNKEKLSAKTIAYKQLIKEADAAISLPTMSVMEKQLSPPSGNKHDYMSIAPYFWPDPNKQDGLPYIRKDGQVNPEVEQYKDKEYLNLLCKSINTLALAYYFSDDEKYAQKAIALLRVWFIDPSTKMNPNLNFGQAIKGVNDGRAEGIIDTRFFMKVVDAIGLISNSNNWTSNDQASMKNWFKEYLKWLEESEIGKDEKKAKNNHGIWYDAQLLSYALFINDKEKAKEIVNSLLERMNFQMDQNGFFPAEMKRTISLHYSVFVMDPLFNVAQMSKHLNLDIWNYTTSKGKSLKLAYQALLPYISKEKDWEGEQIKPFEFQAAVPLLAQGITKYNCNECKESIKEILGEKFEKSVYNLIYSLD